MAKAAAVRRRKIRAWTLAFGGVAALAAVIALAVSAGSSTAGTRTSPANWVLPRLGQPGKVSLTSLRGKPVVVNFFASWCTSCQAELPVFASETRRLRGRVDFVEVNSLETGNGLGMAEQFHLAGAGAIVVSDVGGAQSSGLHDALGGGSSMPVTAFYDSRGQLLTAHVGEFDASSLPAELAQLYGPAI